MGRPGLLVRKGSSAPTVLSGRPERKVQLADREQWVIRVQLVLPEHRDLSELTATKVHWELLVIKEQVAIKVRRVPTEQAVPPDSSERRGSPALTVQMAA